MVDFGEGNYESEKKKAKIDFVGLGGWIKCCHWCWVGEGGRKTKMKMTRTFFLGDCIRI